MEKLRKQLLRSLKLSVTVTRVGPLQDGPVGRAQLDGATRNLCPAFSADRCSSQSMGGKPHTVPTKVERTAGEVVLQQVPSTPFLLRVH